jgi:hypothetical protein
MFVRAEIMDGDCSTKPESSEDSATMRNLNLDNNAGTIAMPPGIYGTFAANAFSKLLGLADAIVAPEGTVAINGPAILTDIVQADCWVLNGKGLLKGAAW